jgi:hypothetical protein
VGSETTLRCEKNDVIKTHLVTGVKKITAKKINQKKTSPMFQFLLAPRRKQSKTESKKKQQHIK